MNNSGADIAAAVAAAFSAFAAFCSIYITVKYNKTTNEMKLRQMLSLARENIEKLATIKNKNKLLNSRIEDLLNVYEEGCEKYLSCKIFRKSFISLYHNDIYKIFNDDCYKDVLNVNRFPNMFKVYLIIQKKYPTLK